MDEFPPELTLQNCKKMLEENEKQLLKKNREILYNNIMDAINNCEKNVTLHFDKKLWQKYRKTITGELLAIYGEIKIITTQKKISITKLTTDIKDIPKNIEKIVIELYKE